MCSCLIRFTSYKAGVLKIKIIEQTFFTRESLHCVSKFSVLRAANVTCIYCNGQAKHFAEDDEILLDKSVWCL